MMKKVFIFIVTVVIFIVPVSARIYDETFPSYVPVSGGAWIEVQTPQGRATIVFPQNNLIGVFGFFGSGYNLCNITTATVNGEIYHSTNFTYWQNPTQLQVRFTRMNTMEVYEPYNSSGNNTSYRWTVMNITNVYATNMGLLDDKGLDRQNNKHIYGFTDKLLIVALVLISGVVLFRAFEKGWKA
jgi:hypothetical protein